MKILSIYILFAALTMFIIIVVDVLSGIRLSDSLHSFYSVFRTTTMLETVCMISFLLLPVVQVAASAVKRRRSR
ncbi:hypothetical protein [Paenibacillus sp. MMS20-IR301]|uniref:hypothetical protein n=1 Tax=Paenibacillus sp. MMS20-IR301 TaxID=2895946 RepID=UPI0028F0EED2|nr:hypothetical protein [Paenibacillus sp. MMS20-IR301]WNS44418.1 hypothetical protein LOS79_03865 [Paenibacillus sp. MMS20-IR301]